MNNELLTETKQYLTFKLSMEIFGVEVSQVREILDFIKITKVPQTPEYMCGVINLRGSVVPVVDLRAQFGIEKSEQTVNTCIVVLEVNLDGEKSIIGALVDAVQEVFELDPSEIEPAPRIGTLIKTGYIKGMGRRDNNFIMLLDIDRIFNFEELEKIESIKTIAESE